jgi:hypothetical protein
MECGGIRLFFLYIHLTLYYTAAFTMSAPLNNTLEPRKCSHSSCRNILPLPEPHKKSFSTCDSCRARDAAYKKRKRQADKDHTKRPAPPPPGQSSEEQQAGGAAVMANGDSENGHAPERPFESGSEDEESNVSDVSIIIVRIIYLPAAVNPDPLWR